jgi:hypothetical protein
MNTLSGMVASDARAKVSELVANFHFSQEGIGEVAELLPESDAELHQWLAQAIADAAENDFIFIVFAAALKERKLQAALLPGGLCLMPEENRMAWIAWRMEGDVSTALLEAVDAGGIPLKFTAMALFIAAAWWLEHRPGQDVPTKILCEANSLAKKYRGQFEMEAYLAAMFCLIHGGKPLPCSFGNGKQIAHAKRCGEKTRKNIFALLRRPFASLLPEKEVHQFVSNATARRAVDKIGRNERCRCGSGKKYKHCCYEQDRERLRHSSDVAGKTCAEVKEDLNADLTRQRLEKLRPIELKKLDPVRVPAELQADYLMRLAIFNCYEALADAFEKLGVPPGLEQSWRLATCFAVKGWRRDVMERLAKASPQTSLTASCSLLMASNDPAQFLQTLEAEALTSLHAADPICVSDIAAGLLSSPYRALGILIARGALPLADRTLASEAFDDILKARGDLNLPPDDEFADFMEERAALEAKHDGTAALHEAQAQLVAKAAQVRRMNEERVRLKRALSVSEKHERRSAGAVNVTGPIGGGEESKRLRAQLKALEALQRETGEERVTLRRKVGKLEQENELLRIANGQVETEAANDEEPGDPVEMYGCQPVRLYKFADKFAQTLAEFPRHVGAAVMTQLGRIASGDPSAFMGLKKMHEADNVVRSRVAGDYRLLLRLTPEVVEVLDVVNRRDLQRRLKLLRAKGA